MIRAAISIRTTVNRSVRGVEPGALTQLRLAAGSSLPYTLGGHLEGANRHVDECRAASGLHDPWHRRRNPAKLHDVYFDDVSWKVLFLLVDTRPWLLGRLVLVSPAMLDDPDVENRMFPTALTKAQVEKTGRASKSTSPCHDSTPSTWPSIGTGLFSGRGSRFDLGRSSGPAAGPNRIGTSDVTHDDPHLRSAADIRGHHVDTPDGRCGHIEDWIVDLASWTIREVVIDTTDWWPGGNVRIPCTEITSMSWDDKSVQVRLSNGSDRGS